MASDSITNTRSNSVSPAASFTNTSASSPALKPAHVSRFVEEIDVLDVPSETASTRSVSPAPQQTQPEVPAEKAARAKFALPSVASILTTLKSALGYVGLGVAILLVSPLLITGGIIAGTFYGYQKLFQYAQTHFYAQPSKSAEDVSVKQD